MGRGWGREIDPTVLKLAPFQILANRSANHHTKRKSMTQINFQGHARIELELFEGEEGNERKKKKKI